MVDSIVQNLMSGLRALPNAVTAIAAAFDRQNWQPNRLSRFAAPRRSTAANAHAMRVAYFTNRYPAVSHTFIRREIRAMEALGLSVARFALRSGADLVDDQDKAEARQTRYVLKAGAGELIRCCVIAAVETTAQSRLSDSPGAADGLALRAGADAASGLCGRSRRARRLVSKRRHPASACAFRLELRSRRHVRVAAIGNSLQLHRAWPRRVCRGFLAVAEYQAAARRICRLRQRVRAQSADAPNGAGSVGKNRDRALRPG